MAQEPLISLCIPTNGVTEWMLPVLESIYSQNVDTNLFEVVITDNGHNSDFKNEIKKYCEKYPNLNYIETDALPFLNEIEAYKRATGKLIKFVNHRTKLMSGTLQIFLDFCHNNLYTKPIVYFSNGAIQTLKQKIYKYDNFNDFVKNLSYWSSWSTGMAIWKDDFKRLPIKIEEYNELFPHTTVLFNERSRSQYLIDNTKLMDELPQGNKPKGNYDLFYAFGVEYPAIILELLRQKSIDTNTFKFIKDKNLEFLSDLYFSYCLRKNYCSYDITGLEKIFNIFYTKKDLYRKTLKSILVKTGRNLFLLGKQK